MIQSRSPAQAKAYFTEALAKADYYVNDQELAGRFLGRLAQRLKLPDKTTKEAFFDLCDNKHPQTGKRLTLRMKDNRTTGYDINFHCPKSVSIMHALAKDDHILKAFQQSVAETMQEIERNTKTRVRKNKASIDRDTGELVWAEFIHQTARPVKGNAPDPHLHAHCFTFNVTWDDMEKKFKAAQFRDIMREMPYYKAAFHKRLSDNLIKQGYQIRRTAKAFEITGVPQKVIDIFSKRTDEIGRIAKQLGITNAKELDGLGARTRGKKQKGMTMEALRKDWRRQIEAVQEKDKSEGGFAEIVRFGPEPERTSISAQRCIDYAVSHCFTRASVVPEGRLLETAYRFSLGHLNVSWQDIHKAYQSDPRIIHVKDRGQLFCTTKEVLAEEKRMVALARDGVGKMLPVYNEAPELTLFGQQAAAVKEVLTTSNRVSIIRGVAGAGKTTLMKEAVEKFNEAGKNVIVVAPTAGASRGVLREEGFENADTVARLLIDKKIEDQVQNQVLIVDEAGLLGTQDMLRVLELTKQKNAQLILIGDTRQHASVVRGDALRILNTVGGIKSAEVNKIYRQQNELYRKAVEDLAAGDIGAAFLKLDELGFIHEYDPLKPPEKMISDYIAVFDRGDTALLVSPTHAQGEMTTQEIRKRLKAKGMIAEKETDHMRLDPTNFTDAEKQDTRNYKQGMAIQFMQNAPKIKRGSRWVVSAVHDQTVHLVSKEGASRILPLDRPKSFAVFEHKHIMLAKGDIIRITLNGFDLNGKRLNNGDRFKVIDLKENGYILLQRLTGKAKTTLEIAQDFWHLTHGHCITSQASQARTVEDVFSVQPASTFAATDAKQFYVTISRGKLRAHIYTDDKKALLEHASRMRDRTSAIELVSAAKQRKEKQRKPLPQQEPEPKKSKDKKAAVKTKQKNDREHER